MQFVIVTGMSGSGKTGTMKVLEDIGFYCIDNMPPQLIGKFAEICSQSDGKIERVAIAADIRGGDLFFQLYDTIKELKKKGLRVKILYLDAQDEILLTRYKETRRKHPLDEEYHGSLQNAITAERKMLRALRSKADYYLDTSFLSTSQMKEQINSIFLDNVNDFMIIKVMSFGFKYGAPNEADLVFDVRCLPNPFYVPELKPLTGLDERVRDFVMNSENSHTLRDKLTDMLDFLYPLYVREGKSQLVVAFGCTGGKHRSVTFAEIMYHHLLEKGLKVRVSHRDIKKGS